MTFKKYRAVFKRSDGQLVGLDFFADDRAMALDHASTVAHDSEMTGWKTPFTVVKVATLPADEALIDKVFYAVRYR